MKNRRLRKIQKQINKSFQKWNIGIKIRRSFRKRRRNEEIINK
jgi:hypothetical protein